MVQISLKIKEIEKICEALDSVDFYLSDNFSQEEEDEFFDDLSSLKYKMITALDRQSKIGHIKDLMKMNELNFMSNAISLDKYLEEKDSLNKRIKEINKEVK